MAKRTYLEMHNIILRRINEDDISDVTTTTGKASIIGDLINEGQNMLFAESNWYPLYKERIFQTSDDAVIVVEDYTGLSLATITISYNGTSYVITEGTDFDAVTSNTVTATAIASALSALTWSDVTIKSNTASSSIVLKADPQNNVGFTSIATSDDETNVDVSLSNNDTYAIPTDFGKSIALVDFTNSTVLRPGSFKHFDLENPDLGTSGTPYEYSIQGGNYRLHPIPSATNIMLEKYWKEPVALAANSDLSELPLEAENALIKWVEGEIWLYLNNSQKAQLINQKFVQLLNKAVDANETILDQMTVVNSTYHSPRNMPLAQPRLPSHYPR
jgi:hypothetical protein|tara:strand:+ start:156 stop:1148 length:993 start_codon:yes stop_codon:yes gene_type:complete